MKTRIRVVATLLALLPLPPAVGQPTVELVWTATSGPGTPGTSEIFANQGDFLQLDIWIQNCGQWLESASVSLYWDQSLLTGFGAQECVSPPNIAPGFCDDQDATFFSPVVPGVIELPGLAEGFDAGNGFPPKWGFYCATMYLGRTGFVYGGTGGQADVVVRYRPGIDGIVERLGAVHTPSGSAIVNKTAGCF